MNYRIDEFTRGNVKHDQNLGNYLANKLRFQIGHEEFRKENMATWTDHNESKDMNHWYLTTTNTYFCAQYSRIMCVSLNYLGRNPWFYS